MPDDKLSIEERVARLEGRHTRLVEAIKELERCHNNLIEATNRLIAGHKRLGELTKSNLIRLSKHVTQRVTRTDLALREFIKAEAKSQAQVYVREILHAEAGGLAELSKSLQETQASVSFLYQRYNSLIREMNTDKPGESLLRLTHMDGRVTTVRREITINEPGSGND